ncbi:Anthocyanin 5-aromatic acyltransferase [Vitis vinifera]|uniref:Anthocyanin 5-aromatic acyltransferase n=1 Tax=Vitis vinifera TaxID=29760 RepID=A0A438IEL0_VITVI|nr:Anthocyanin 5-aromatic acyltransferase [Vitis vinifera]
MVESGTLPFYDRTMVKDPNGLASVFWNHVGKIKFEGSQRQLSTNKVIATFILGQSHVQQLKKWVLSQCPTSSHVSTFTVTCAYVWTCMIAELSCSPHCLQPTLVTAWYHALQLQNKGTDGDNGFIVAAKTIGEAIQERLRKKEGVLKDAEKWISEFETRKEDRIVESQDHQESFEIGLSLPKIKMDAFEDIFANGFQV